MKLLKTNFGLDRRSRQKIINFFKSSFPDVGFFKSFKIWMLKNILAARERDELKAEKLDGQARKKNDGASQSMRESFESPQAYKA